MDDRSDLDVASGTLAELGRVALAIESAMVHAVPTCLSGRTLPALDAFADARFHDVALHAARLKASLTAIPTGQMVEMLALLMELNGAVARLADAVKSLREFRLLPWQQVSSLVASLLKAYADTGHIVRDLEHRLGCSTSFYDRRPSGSAKLMGDFLGSLESTFRYEWSRGKEGLDAGENTT